MVDKNRQKKFGSRMTARRGATILTAATALLLSGGDILAQQRSTLDANPVYMNLPTPGPFSDSRYRFVPTETASTHAEIDHSNSSVNEALRDRFAQESIVQQAPSRWKKFVYGFVVGAVSGGLFGAFAPAEYCNSTTTVDGETECDDRGTTIALYAGAAGLGAGIGYMLIP